MKLPEGVATVEIDGPELVVKPAVGHELTFIFDGGELRLAAQIEQSPDQSPDLDPDFHCLDCGVPVRDDYMVLDDLWEAHVEPADREGEVCIRCFQKRLGRPYRLEDLTDCPVNEVARYLLGPTSRQSV